MVLRFIVANTLFLHLCLVLISEQGFGPKTEIPILKYNIIYFMQNITLLTESF